MPTYTKVTISGPKEKVLILLRNARENLEANGSAVVPVDGNDRDDNVVIELMDDDYGEGPTAPVLAEVVKKEE